jgi:hypothetical protein
LRWRLLLQERQALQVTASQRKRLLLVLLL